MTQGPDPQTKMQFLFALRSKGVTDGKVFSCCYKVFHKKRATVRQDRAYLVCVCVCQWGVWVVKGGW